MSKSIGPKSYSRPTVKRLFALSGNRCAFPECPLPLVDPDTGSIIGEVCHIKGEKPSAPRYDAEQDDHARHGFDNLILLCNIHHKVVDDKPDVYPVERLRSMKEIHEAHREGKNAVDDATSEVFVLAAMSCFAVQGDVIQTANVSGGQVAHTIMNHHYYVVAGTRPLFRIATHEGAQEIVDENRCERYGSISVPNWLGDTPSRLCDEWLVERLQNGADLHLYLDRSWCGGIWFVVDMGSRTGVVINRDQLPDLMPASPTTTTTMPPQ